VSERTDALAANVAKSYIYAFLMEAMIWLPIWVLYLRDQRHLSLTQITLLDVPFFMLIVVAEVPTGAIADRFGRKFSMAGGSALLCAALLVFGIATNYPLILVSYVVWGFAMTLRSGADTALLYDSLKDTGRTDDFTRVNGRLVAVRSVAILVGLLVGAPIAAATSFTFTIAAGAIIHGSGALVSLSLQEPAQEQNDGAAYLRTLVDGLREAYRAPQLRYIFAYSGVISACVAVPLVVMQQPWLAERGIGTGELGWWQAPARVAEVGAALSAAWLLMRFGERAAFFALPLVVIGCNLALAGISHAWIASAFVGLGFVNGVQHPLLSTYVNVRVASARRATVLSVQNLAGSLCLVVLWPTSGIVADAAGLQGAFLMASAAAAVLGGTALLLWARTEPGPIPALTILEPTHDPMAISSVLVRTGSDHA
jgi:MFS family permease